MVALDDEWISQPPTHSLKDLAKSKVASTVVSVLNPYYKKGKIVSKVWLIFEELCLMEHVFHPVGERGEASPKKLFSFPPKTSSCPLCILVILVIVLTSGLIASPQTKIPR